MIYLREITERDLPLISAWRQDPELCRWLVGPHIQTTPELTQQWWQAYQQAKPHQIRFAICEEIKRSMIGRVDLIDINFQTHQAEFQVLIASPAYRRHGYGLKATQMCLRYGFNELKLQRIYLHVLAYNQPAIKMYEKAGFRQEQVIEKGVLKEGVHHDVVLMAVYNSL